ncbi:MAG: barstar family protein [Anaerolineae bacterium]|nr:barstar family protein [Anaerolineae bacterium]
MHKLIELFDQARDSGVYCLDETELTDDVDSLSSQMGIFVANMDGETISNKQEFLDQISRALKFPFFGNNWDALLDCLRDLSWLPLNGRVLVFDNFQNLANNDRAAFNTALEIMQEAAEFWQTRMSNKPLLYVLLRGDNALLPNLQVL